MLDALCNLTRKEEDKVDMVFDTAGDLSSERQGFAVLKSKGRYIPAALSYFTIFRVIQFEISLIPSLLVRC